MLFHVPECIFVARNMARDIFHDIVKVALEKDGWTITDNHLRLSAINEVKLETDLGGSKVIGAAFESQRIAVEVKGFQRPSLVYEFHAAYGQYLIYEDVIERRNLDWVLHLAIPDSVFKILKELEHIMYSIAKRNLRILLFNPDKKIITSWIS